MVKGLYTAYTGMLNEQNRLDIISNNLANAATAGFKKDGVTNQSFDDVLTYKINDQSEGGAHRKLGTMSLGVKIGEVYTNHSQGSLRQSQNTYDLAIEGSGFFSVAVMNKNGEESIRYTRDGSFKVTSDGYVVDVDGNRLIGETGYIQIPKGNEAVTIDLEGNVFKGQTKINQVKLTDFEDYNQLKKVGNNLYEAVTDAKVKETTAVIQQGYIEQSNVQSVTEMVDMIAVTRAYEANQKVINTVDTMLEKAVNSVGRV